MHQQWEVLADNAGGGGSCTDKAPMSPQVNERCQHYAERAIEQMQKATGVASCRVRVDARWSFDYQQHYDWCLTAQDASLYSEEKARADHLDHCTQPIPSEPIRSEPFPGEGQLIDEGPELIPVD